MASEPNEPFNVVFVQSSIFTVKSSAWTASHPTFLETVSEEYVMQGLHAIPMDELLSTRVAAGYFNSNKTKTVMLLTAAVSVGMTQVIEYLVSIMSDDYLHVVGDLVSMSMYGGHPESMVTLMKTHSHIYTKQIADASHYTFEQVDFRPTFLDSFIMCNKYDDTGESVARMLVTVLRSFVDENLPGSVLNSMIKLCLIECPNILTLDLFPTTGDYYTLFMIMCIDLPIGAIHEALEDFIPADTVHMHTGKARNVLHILARGNFTNDNAHDARIQLLASIAPHWLHERNNNGMKPADIEARHGKYALLQTITQPAVKAAI